MIKLIACLTFVIVATCIITDFIERDRNGNK